VEGSDGGRKGGMESRKDVGRKKQGWRVGGRQREKGNEREKER